MLVAVALVALFGEIIAIARAISMYHGGRMARMLRIAEGTDDESDHQVT